MKKTIITLVAVLTTAFAANAQFYAGGSAGISVISVDKGASSIGWSLAPEVGYNINDRIGAGLALTLSGSPVNFCANPYFRWYFADAGNFRFLADAIVSLGTSDSEFFWGVKVAPGLAYELNSNWGIVSHLASVGFESSRSHGIFLFNVLQGASVGFYYNF